MRFRPIFSGFRARETTSQLNSIRARGASAGAAAGRRSRCRCRRFLDHRAGARSGPTTERAEERARLCEAKLLRDNGDRLSAFEQLLRAFATNFIEDLLMRGLVFFELALKRA